MPTPTIPLVTGQPQTLLNAATTTGTSAYILDIWPTRGGFPLHYTWATTITGTPSGVTLNLEGSIDGTNWYQIDQSISTSGEMRSVVNRAVRWVRLNLLSLTGGTSPTVTGIVMGVAP